MRLNRAQDEQTLTELKKANPTVAVLMSSYRLGIDIGGTFTDAVLLDESSGEWQLVKLSSTPDDPSRGFLNVVERILRESDAPPEDVAYLVHATTVATNTIIEGKGAKTALIATEGFRDVFEIARQIRPELYNIFCDKPPPLVPRNLCFEVTERLDYAGKVITSLDERSVLETVEAIRWEEVEAVAVCLLHSYVNPIHEKRVGEIIRNELPGVSVSISSEMCPEMREFFRASTTAINSLLMPIMSRYVKVLENRLGDLGIAKELRLMTSSGGVIASEVAAKEPVHLIESGPAAGVIAAAHLGSSLGIPNVISLDMGGTTAKVGLIQDGEPKISPHFEVGTSVTAEGKGAGYPVRTPVVDLVEIGAGGGSIAWADPGGGMRVGPQSGGAAPGPACYGLGQEEPCVTDANLTLGCINPDYFLGGEHKLDGELAEGAIKNLGEKLGLGIIETANGIIEIANANMTGAVRLISVQRGFDPREFVLVAFGGAGPMHANALAQELQIPKVLIPMSPGVFSAFGLLVCDIRHDHVQAHLQPLDALDFDAINSTFRTWQEWAVPVLENEGVEQSRITFTRYLDMRYVGQSYELKIEIPDRDLRPNDINDITEDYFKEHERAYGFASRSEPAEVVNLRMTSAGEIERPKSTKVEEGGPDASNAVKIEREVYFAEAGILRCHVYDRYRLKAGNRIPGPAIIEERDSTTVIHPSYQATVDQQANLMIERFRM